MSEPGADPVSQAELELTRVHKAVIVYFAFVFLALIWPIYPLFAGIRPMLLGMPLSLWYIVAVLLVSFGVLLGLYLWDGRRVRRR